YEDFPSSFARLPDGSTLVGFAVQSVRHDPAMRYNFGRLLPNGSLDGNFRLSSSRPNSILIGNVVSNGFAQLADGSFFVFGLQPDYGWVLGVFLSNGAEDRSFHPDPFIPY